MTEKTELVYNTGQIIDQSDGIHDVIFNRLNSWHTNGGRRRFYDADEFKKVLSEFNSTPQVFAKTHPMNIGKIPLEDALLEVDGRLIGTPQDILVTNTNVLTGQVKITDKEVDERMSKGEIHVSTAFSASVDESGRYYDIKPNHILFYPIETGIEPGDSASLILNQSENNGHDTMTDEKNGQLELLREIVQNQAVKDELQTKVSEQSETIYNQKTEISDLKSTVSQKDVLLSQKEETITNQASAIETLNKRVAELTNNIAETKASEKTKRRERIWNQYSPGTRKTFEERKTEFFDDDLHDDIAFEMNQAERVIPQPPTQESGNETVVNQEGALPYINGVKQTFDPMTGKWKYEGA